jgi:O-antigen/teichoic acid export membrane protein
LINVVVSFVSSILLARWLPVEVFGVVAMANSVVQLSVQVANFGLAGAFVHRSPETQDEEQAAAIHFTLKLILTAVWTIIMVVSALLFTSDQLRTALLLTALAQSGVELTQTPKIILGRRVRHRRLALIQILSTVLCTLVSLVLASKGVALWALLSANLVSLVINFVALYGWRPIWRPRLAWSTPIVRYFFDYGGRNFLSIILLKALDRLDDLWTGAYLGTKPLGFYSRAYGLATYPRRILAQPLYAVAGGTYAELKGDRPRLSRAFFVNIAFLVRSGFFLAGLIALIAPEFINLVLGAKWLPMLDAFRLMLVFTLLDPIQMTVGDLFLAVGDPNQVITTRVVQLIVLGVGLYSLGPLMGIAGVALAVDGMLGVGMIILLWRARAYVDFSLKRAFAMPSLALITGLILASGANLSFTNSESELVTGSVKLIVFFVTYSVILLAAERRQILEVFTIARTSIQHQQWGFSILKEEKNI